MTTEAKTIDEQARQALARMQLFDVTTLPRESELGQRFSFKAAVDPARRLVDLYKRLAVTVLEDLPERQLKQLHSQALQDYTRLDQILSFDPSEGTDAHQRLINELTSAYQATFDTLHPLIAYSLHKSADFQRLEGEARAAVQTIKDEAEATAFELNGLRDQAAKTLEEVQKVAAEHGVTQQAVYFKKSADDHEADATTWRKVTIWLALGLGVYSGLSMFFHKVPILVPHNSYDTVELGISKVLVFAVISFMLYLSSRNFLSHKHNAIVDRHRQNALMTYKALVEAAGDTPNREVILVQAAACIFGPQSTGYSKEAGMAMPGVQSAIEFIAKPFHAGVHAPS